MVVLAPISSLVMERYIRGLVSQKEQEKQILNADLVFHK